MERWMVTARWPIEQTSPKSNSFEWMMGHETMEDYLAFTSSQKLAYHLIEQDELMTIALSTCNSCTLSRGILGYRKSKMLQEAHIRAYKNKQKLVTDFCGEVQKRERKSEQQQAPNDSHVQTNEPTSRLFLPRPDSW